MSIDQRLKSLGLTLPPPSTPGGAYMSAARSGCLLFVSGHIAKRDGKPHVGRLGATLSTEEGRVAARNIGLELLATMQAFAQEVGGGLDHVLRVVKLVGLVNCTADFTESHLVINGCSNLLVDVLGDRGRHARSAFGVAQLPMGACVEIELVAELDPLLGLAEASR